MFLLPGFFILAAFLASRFSVANPWVVKFEKIAPYAILATGAILSWAFHRSRLILILLILFISERSLFYFSTGGQFAFGHENSILLANGLLLPINIAFFYLIKERTIFSPGGLVKIGLIVLQVLAAYLLLRLAPEISNSLSQQFSRQPRLANLPLSQPVLLVYGVILLVFFLGSLSGRGPIVRGFFWALIATLLALVSKSHGQSPILYYSAAGLIIILAVIETAYAMAFQDDLTGLPARRALNSAMHGLGRRYTIAMLDIDFFKKFNDRYGHDVGDQVLRMVASHLRQVGGGGRPYRYGGEEFTLLFPGKYKEEALPYLERLRQSIETARFVVRAKNRPRKKPRKILKTQTNPSTVSVTVSIGVAEPAAKRSKATAVIKAADQALYRAKKRGRNCIVSK